MLFPTVLENEITIKGIECKHNKTQKRQMNGDHVPFRSLNSMLSFSVAEHRALNILSLKTKWLCERSTRLPPKMKCVQRAAWAARACGSWAQASWSEAGSQIEVLWRTVSLRTQPLKLSAYVCRDIHELACINHRAASCMTIKGFFSVKRCVAEGLPQQWSITFHCLSMKWFWIVHLLMYRLITCANLIQQR